MPEVHHTQARAQTTYQSQKEAEQGAGVVSELFHLRLALLTPVGLSKAVVVRLHFSKGAQIVSQQCQSHRGMQEQIPGRHSAQLLAMTLLHETGGTMLRALLHCFVVCACAQGSWAICSAVGSARLPGGVC